VTPNRDPDAGPDRPPDHGVGQVNIAGGNAAQYVAGRDQTIHHHGPPGGDGPGTGRRRLIVGVIGVVATFCTITGITLTGSWSWVHDRLTGTPDTPATTTVSASGPGPTVTVPTRRTRAELRTALIERDDLPTDWALIHPKAGAEGLGADEFCGPGQYPQVAATVTQEFASYSGGPTSAGRPGLPAPFLPEFGQVGPLSLFSTVAEFPDDTTAAGFLHQIEDLSGRCDTWTSTAAPNQPAPVESTIVGRGPVPGLGDDAYRVRVGGGGIELDFLYTRVQNLVGAVTYGVTTTNPQTPALDPNFTDTKAHTVAQRLERLRR
jgi:hypothetical protein